MLSDEQEGIKYHFSSPNLDWTPVSLANTLTIMLMGRTVPEKIVGDGPSFIFQDSMVNLDIYKQESS